MLRRDALAGLAAFTLVGVSNCGLAAASAVRRLAVICQPGDDDTRGDVSRFESRLGGSLLKTGQYSLVDRERLDKIISEQGFSNSAYADPKTAAKLGKLAGAERFLDVRLAANVESDPGSFTTTVAYHVSADFTLVDVSTGGISSQGSADGDAQDKLSSGTSGVSSIELSRLRREAIDSCIDDLVQQLSS